MFDLVWIGAVLVIGFCVAGYVYHRWPQWFSKATDAGAAVVNDAIDKAKDAIKK